jgi:hypothetical protein
VDDLFMPVSQPEEVDTAVAGGQLSALPPGTSYTELLTYFDKPVFSHLNGISPSHQSKGIGSRPFFLHHRNDQSKMSNCLLTVFWIRTTVFKIEF